MSFLGDQEHVSIWNTIVPVGQSSVVQAKFAFRCKIVIHRYILCVDSEKEAI